MCDEIAVWATDRNQRWIEINWQFRTEDGRIKLNSLIPTL